jgi:uncharacterized protein YgiM (DUF1202 family)
MLKIAGGIILAIILLSLSPLMCGLCAVGTGAVMEENKKQERKEQKQTVAAAAPTGQSVMYKSRCNVRSKPSTRSKVIAKASADTAYPVIEDKGKWKKIEIDGQEGWTGCKDKR